jgi:hypothetical protein
MCSSIKMSAGFDGRLTIIESIAKGLRSYSQKGAILTESDHDRGGIRGGLLRRFCGRCSRNVHGSKNHSLARYRSENWKPSGGGSSLLLPAGALATGVGSILWMPERYAKNEFGCIRSLQLWYLDQGCWRGQPSSCRERAAEFESASSQIVTVWDIALRRKAVEIEERERKLSGPHIAFTTLLVNLLLPPRARLCLAENHHADSQSFETPPLKGRPDRLRLPPPTSGRGRTRSLCGR